ncbi:MAG: nuclear transport factor 2 family protein [Gammaproteobacteria bacterium]|nr:nuclear transport factor 2 family protein [Gammaproteobacteria bacterium]
MLEAITRIPAEVRMRKVVLGLAASLIAMAATVTLAGYADDRAEIENLSNKYMVAVDAGDIDTVMSTWAEDGVLEWIAGVEVGKAAIYKVMSGFGGARKVQIPENATSRPRTRHQIINHVIDVNGDTAKTTAYWFALTNNTPQKDVQLLAFGHYEDELVRVQGKWLFKKRKVYNESQVNRAVFYPGLGEQDPRKR